MSASLIQLASRGTEDNYLIGKPQFTLFKFVFKRHTNFSIQQIPIKFSTNTDFNNKVSLNVNKFGDMIYKMNLYIVLPELPQIYNVDGTKNEIIKYAWSKNIGHVIINYIDIEINNVLIDKQYGEWLHIYHNIKDDDKNIDKLLGNIPDLYNFTSSKPEYKLIVPLYFYFNNDVSLSIPLLDGLKVSINLELNELSKCLIIAPSHYIDILDPFINLNVGDLLVQNRNNNSQFVFGKFIYFDQNKKRLYYQQSTYETFDDSNFICSKDFIITPYDKTYSYIINNQPNIKLKNCFLLVDYIFLDIEEKNTIINNKNSVVITQIQKNTLYSSNSNYIENKLNFTNNVLYICWFSQYKILRESFNNDYFNFSNISKDIYDLTNNLFTNKNTIINKCNILFNNNYRISDINSKYYNLIENLNKFNKHKSNINIYSFSIYPLMYQPSGCCDFKEISDVKIQLEYNKNLMINSEIVFQCYAMNYKLINYADFI